MSVKNFKYTERLYLVRRINGAGHMFEIARDYRVEFEIDGYAQIFKVPGGMLTDLASIPKFVPKWLAQKVDGGLEAAIVHDKICYDREESGFTSNEAADIYRAGLIAAKVSRSKRWAMYYAVKWLGPQWD